MSRDVGLRVEGARQLRKTIRDASDGMQDMKDIHRSVASLVSDRSQGAVPRGETGNLARSIRPGATKTAAVVRAGNRRATATGVPYAPVIHWGWPARNISPQTFLADAAKQTEPTWLKLYTDKVNDLIEKVKGI